MNTDIHVPALSDERGDRAIVLLAALSLMALLALLAAHSPLALGLLVPAAAFWLHSQREARANRQGMRRLQLAVAAAIVRGEGITGTPSRSAHRARPRLQVMAGRTE